MQLVFQDPKFRLFWIGTVFNDVGMIMHFTVHGFLVLTVTNSPFWVGFVAGIGGLGLFSFSAIGGVLADRVDRRKLIVSILLLQVVLVSIIAALVFSGDILLWHLVIMSFLEGTLIAVKVPARMAMTLDVAGRDKLLRATAANLAAMTSVGIFVPLLGGEVGERFDIGWAYVIMAFAYLISASLMLMLRNVSRVIENRESPWYDLKSGVVYAFTTPRVRMLILLGLTSELFGWAHETMMPVMARDVLNIGLSGQGYLLSAGSVGALIATLILSSRGESNNKGRMLVSGYFGFGFFLVLFAASPLIGWLPLSLLMIALAYASVMLYEAALGTLLQTAVPDKMRGRVVSFQIMTWGLTGVSGFHTGAIASLVGAPVAIAVGGGVLMLNTLRLLGRVSIFQTQRTEEVAGD